MCLTSALSYKTTPRVTHAKSATLWAVTMAQSTLLQPVHQVRNIPKGAVVGSESLVFSWMKKGVGFLFSLLARNLVEKRRGIWETWVLLMALLKPPSELTLSLWSSVSSSTKDGCIGYPLTSPTLTMHDPWICSQGNCRTIRDIMMSGQKKGKWESRPHIVEQVYQGVSGRQPKSAKERPRRWAWVKTSSEQEWEPYPKVETLCSFPTVCFLMNLGRQILGFMFTFLCFLGASTHYLEHHSYLSTKPT